MDESEKFVVASLPIKQEELHELLPGLPNCVVLDCVLPRIPWYARAVLTGTSKAWKQALREPCIYGELSRRTQGTSKSPKGLVMVHHLSAEATLECYMKLNTNRRMPRPHAISILEQGNHTQRRPQQEDDALQGSHPSACMCVDRVRTWRNLPPIPAFVPLRILQDCGVACVDGKIFVMGGWDPRTDAVHADVYMLNIAAGLWEWEAMPPMHFARAFFHCTSMANKIYVVGGTSSPYVDDPDPEVFDVETNSWMLLPRVSMSRSFHFNGLSLVKEGTLVLSHGFCTTERGELINFRRTYDPALGMWSEYECVDDVKDDDVVRKCDDGREIAGKCSNFMVRECGMHAAAQQISGVIMSVMMM